ncbi:LIM homeobox transcription factor 1-beta-like [Chamaea fasciata]|uniref:LIM homeobox transcription factor 1-beta-like n=1 Tax=Chamaea fasciata TaxID=190680 RepID=UPI003369BD7E
MPDPVIPMPDPVIPMPAPVIPMPDPIFPLPIPGSIPLLCAGCGGGIRDRFLLRVNERPWHERCLRCCECARPLRGSCFCRRRRLYCRPDYRRLFPARCSSCLRPVARWELVLRLRDGIFHPRCLRCGRCSRRLGRGDAVLLRAGSVLCSRHWDAALGSADQGEGGKNRGKKIGIWGDFWEFFRNFLAIF